MRLQKASMLGLIGSFAIGAMVALGVMNNYSIPHEPASTTVNTVGDESSASATPTPTPTESMSPGNLSTPSAVEGDDGSLGGPVYTAPSQTTPEYVYPTSENANDDTATPDEPTDPVTRSGSPTEVPETRDPAPTVSRTPSPDDHTPTQSETP